MSEQITAWLHHYQSILTFIGLGSALMFLFSLLMLPLLLKQIPVDYFSRNDKSMHWAALLLPRNVVRNLLGVPVLLAGILMLVLPGQGILTIFIGIAIMQFPGKYTLERWLASQKGVLAAINWIRHKTDTPDLEL